jgi:hypothetical protein
MLWVGGVNHAKREGTGLTKQEIPEVYCSTKL